jgi:inner membrane protein
MNIASHWLWLIAGLILVGIEAAAPGLFLLWVGLAALATGLVVWLVPLQVTAQLVLFALLGLAAILVGRKVQGRQQSEVTDSPHLNERGKALLGKTCVLESAIANGFGSARLGDTVWRVSGADIAAGATVRITGVDGSTLSVEAA